MTTTPEPSIGTLPMIFAHAAYNANPQSVLDQYPGFTNGWNVVWSSDFSQPNYAFIGSNGNDYIMAIRGSLLQFSKDAYINWIKEDLKVFSQEQWTWFVPSSESNNYNAVIASGAYTGLTTLQSLTDSSGTTPADFLIANGVNNDGQIIITGHSLGGNLTSVFAPWFQWYLNNNTASNYNGKNTPYPNLQSFTFAAPAAGNEDFAGYYNALFGENAFRFYNNNDIVPTFPANIGTTADMFSQGPNANDISVTIDSKVITLHDFFEGISVTLIADMLLKKHGYYLQTNADGGAYSFNISFDPSYMNNTIENWLGQAGWQHSGDNYLGYFLTLPQPLKPAHG